MIRGSAGFTLLDVLVVLVILGLTGAGMVAALPSWRAGQDLRRAADEVGRLLIAARHDAVTGRRLVVLAIDGQGRLVRRDTSRTYTPPPGISLTLAGIGGSERGTLVFLGDGSSTGGDVTLATGSIREIRRVHWLTGRIDAAR